MASTYTSNLRLEQMADGENDTTWGGKANTVFALIEEALTGMETISTTSGTVTLTTNNSTSDQARKSVIKLTATLVGNLVIEVPAVNKHYMIWNATSGNYTVTVKVNGQTGIVISQGAKEFVFCDGTDVRETLENRVKADGDTITGPLNMSGASVIHANSSIAAHATTMNPWNLGNYVTATGAAVTFTNMTAAPQAGAEIEIYMNAAHIFTNGSVFEVDGGQNYTATIGDRVLIRAKTTTVFTVHPRKKDGTPISSGFPAGTIIDFGGSSAPTGYLACNGAAVSRTTYSALFAAIGTLWGVGDGSTTFNLPNFAAGDAAVQNNGTVGASTDGQMPAHTHSVQGGGGSGGGGYFGYFDTFSSNSNTGSSGSGTRNFAAGKYVLKCIKT